MNSKHTKQKKFNKTISKFRNNLKNESKSIYLIIDFDEEKVWYNQTKLGVTTNYTKAVKTAKKMKNLNNKYDLNLNVRVIEYQGVINNDIWSQHKLNLQKVCEW